MIGGGAGGLAAAAAAAAMGVPVVLIEKGRMGGQSLNGGAVPSKALLAAAEHANAVRAGARFGVKSVRSGIDFAAVMAHVRHAVAGRGAAGFGRTLRRARRARHRRRRAV